MSDPKDVADGVAEMSLSQRKKMEKMKKIQEQKAAKQAAKAAAAAATPTQAGTKQANEVPALVLDTSLPPATEVRVVDVHKHTGQRVKVFAWVQYVRDQGSLVFLDLRDGSGAVPPVLQCVLTGKLAKTAEARQLLRETAVEIFGTVVSDERAPHGVELKADYWNVVGPSDPELEERFNESSHPDVLLDQRFLHIRSVRFSSILRLRSITTAAFREFFYSRDFSEVTPPTLVQTEVEGGADLFTVNYFGEDAYLTQSSQLYLETVIPSLGNAFCIMPSYRAEKSRTRRHLSEFTHVEGEMAFYTFEKLLQFVEDMVVTVSQIVVDKAGPLLYSVNPDFKPPKGPFLRMKYSEAIAWLNEHNVPNEETKQPWKIGDGISEAPERHMNDEIGQPILLYGFPADQKPFYMSRADFDNNMTESVDLLMPGVGEIVGGSMREWDLQRLKDAYAAKNLDPTPYGWYNDLRKFGTCPHGGFGLGLERFLCWILKLDHIREVSLYPRFVGRCSP
ncbi:asparagine--tRNA ligase [Plasmodiophora brassicae]|uniref:asparagine--tRNA ligase n=1 Tax=Plasmodiophora brassicae TaxID=37360 RepID=A0A3P3YAI2_PLABS|nr:unnamed protein product [Plasmodiophora brassicae]